MSKIKHRVLVLSGKGGVGKSTCSAQIAFGLARQGFKVGLLDVDVCGPSIPTMMGLKGREVHQSSSGWSPVYVDVEDVDDCELAVMSIGFLMPDPDAAVIWRGPKKNGLLTQFFNNVDWGYLDYLIIDTPPGTSDEHISIMQLLKPYLNEGDGAVVVTTPQEVSMTDVRKELNFCKQTNLKVIGIIENMSAMTVPISGLNFVAKNTGEDKTQEVLKLLALHLPSLQAQFEVKVDVFPEYGKGPKGMAELFKVPYLGKIPLDATLQQACESGNPGLISSSSVKGSVLEILKKIINTTRGGEEQSVSTTKEAAVASTTSQGKIKVLKGVVV